VIKKNVVIIGYSFSGISAALELSRNNFSVTIFEWLWDNPPLKNMMFVDLGKKNIISGCDYRDKCDELFRINNIIVENYTLETKLILDRTYVDSEIFFCLFGTGFKTLGDYLIIAPNPFINGPDDNSVIRNALGRGVSYCIADDGFSYKNMPVIVEGNDYRAIEVSIEALQYSKDVTLICEQSMINAPSFWLNLLSQYNIKIIFNCKIVECIFNDKENLCSVKILINNSLENKDVGIIYYSKCSPPYLEPIESSLEYSAMLKTKKVYFAGLTNNINAWEHSKLYSDGTRVANEIITHSSNRG